VLADFRLKHQTQVVRQVRDHVRNLIVTGALAHGAKLPSTAALAEDWGIRAPTVQDALAELVQAGLLERQPGRGTFVCSERPALTAMAVYEHADRIANPESNIHRVILAELQRQLSAEGIRVQLIVDPRSGSGLAEPWAPLMELSDVHRVGATIAASTYAELLPWLSRLPRLAAFVDDPRIAGRVTQDFDQMADICLDGLVDAGCHSVGLICALPHTAHLPDGRFNPQAEFYDHFLAATQDRGLKIANDWIHLAPPTVVAGQFAQAGYDLFKSLWKKDQRPDGLVVYPDSFMPGVLMAMAELGVRVPQDLRLAYHRNEQTPILSPHPATEAVLSEREIAAALIAQAKRVWKGEPCETVKVRFTRVNRKRSR